MNRSLATQNIARSPTIQKAFPKFRFFYFYFVFAWQTVSNIYIQATKSGLFYETVFIWGMDYKSTLEKQSK